MAMERTPLVLVHASRGEPDRAVEALSAEILEASEDVQAVGTLALGRAWLHRYAGRYEEAIASARTAIGTREQLGMVGLIEGAYAVGAEAALAAGDSERAKEFLAEMERVPPGDQSLWFRAEFARLRARIAAAEGDAIGAQAGFENAVTQFRDQGLRFHLAVALAEEGEWLAAGGRIEDARPLLSEAREIFESLRATWWLERLREVSGEEAPSTAAGARYSHALE
jgi:tetratricopeptide (TPR) repeat protein